MNSQELDKAAAAIQKTPNRVTLEQVESKIDSIEYIHPATAPHYTLAFVKLKNGFVVTGVGACADPQNFNEEFGQKLAREKAIQEIWALEAYQLCEKLATTPTEPDLPQAMQSAA